jgi:hypothetical protein
MVMQIIEVSNGHGYKDSPRGTANLGVSPIYNNRGARRGPKATKPPYFTLVAIPYRQKP